MSEAALSVRIDEKRYVGAATGALRLPLAGVVFSAEPGEFVAIVGPSGCGKTTLLNIVAGLDTDFTGRIARAPGRLAYVFQSPRLLPWRSVLQNILLAAGPESEAEARALLAEVGLAGYETAFPGELSTGMQRRAALVRAFAMRPSLLLMDEPFVSLDEETADRLRATLVALWRARPTTVLFVTHDSREAVRLADRILVLGGSPARVMRSLPVPLSAAERLDGMAVDRWRATLGEPAAAAAE